MTRTLSAPRTDIVASTGQAKDSRGTSAVEASSAHALGRALADYVRVVAVAVGVPAEGVTWEVTDTVTAYLALTSRSAEHPGRDVMLVWEESQGWAISVETAPAEAPIVLSRLGGDVVPAPETVVSFVAGSIARPGATWSRVTRTAQVDRADLVERMDRRTRARR